MRASAAVTVGIVLLFCMSVNGHGFSINENRVTVGGQRQFPLVPGQYCPFHSPASAPLQFPQGGQAQPRQGTRLGISDRDYDTMGSLISFLTGNPLTSAYGGLGLLRSAF